MTASIKNVTRHKSHCFILNVEALGDVISTLPAMKYAAEKIFTDGRYYIMMHKQHRELFSFIPEKNVFYFGKEKHLTDLPVIVYMYDAIPENVPLSAFLSPLHMSLTDYSSVKLLGMLLPDGNRDYPKLELDSVDVGKFNLPKRYVCILPTILHKNRGLPKKEVYRISYHLIKHGITPVFLGKNTTITDTFNRASYSSSSPEAKEGMIDLIDKTSLMEAAKVMAGAECVVGLDTGLIHLAACTDVKIICGYTTVEPSLRLPSRHGELGWNITPITPKPKQCKFCASSWFVDDLNFNECNNSKQFECLEEMTADNFIEAMAAFGIVETK